MGGILALMPSTAVIGIIMWCLIFQATGFVSLASLFFAISLPITSFAFGYSTHGVVLTLFLCATIFFCHRKNIRRLCNGSEYRFGGK
jgi:glycerol-3-phosphate acyltransferase PlsY